MANIYQQLRKPGLRTTELWLLPLTWAALSAWAYANLWLDLSDLVTCAGMGATSAGYAVYVFGRSKSKSNEAHAIAGTSMING